MLRTFRWAPGEKLKSVVSYRGNNYERNYERNSSINSLINSSIKWELGPLPKDVGP